MCACAHVSMCVCVCVPVLVHTAAERVSDPLDLEFQEVVIFLVWVLAPELGFSARTAFHLDSWAISLAPYPSPLPSPLDFIL